MLSSKNIFITHFIFMLEQFNIYYSNYSWILSITLASVIYHELFHIICAPFSFLCSNYNMNHVFLLLLLCLVLSIVLHKIYGRIRIYNNIQRKYLQIKVKTILKPY